MELRSNPLEALLAELRDAPPYPGLRPFLANESKYFRGREQQILEIGQRLADQGCVSVLGGSGSGKSSIVRAGVIPALRRKLIAGRGDLWRTALFTPGLAPIENLVASLEQTLRSPGNQSERRSKIRDALYGPHGLGGFLPAFGGELDVDPGLSARALERANLLVVIDQFEELFRAENLGKPQVARLVNLVVEYWKKRPEYPGLYLAITMRTDDLHRCAEFIELPEFINATSYLTRRLKEEELRDAIVAPVRPPLFRAGLLQGATEPGTEDLRPYDVRVVTELLDAVAEIAHDPDHLPLLQHLLAVMWRLTLERWQTEGDGNHPELAAHVTLDDLAGALGFAGWDALEAYRDKLGNGLPRGWILRYCLEHVAEALYRGELFGTSLNAAQQGIARTAFCLMGDVDDRGSFKRRWTTEDEIVRVSGHQEATRNVKAFIRRFGDDHRLIWQRDAGEIDVCHEALMRNWPRLAAWLREDRAAAVAYRDLDKRYRQWREAWSRGWRWLSWLRKRNGLLRDESLENIAPLLARKSHLGFGAEPLHRAYWTRRAISSDHADDQRGYVRTLASDAERTRIEHRYAERFGYLRASMLRNQIFRILPRVALVSALIGSVVLGRWWHEIADQQRQFVATVLWDGLEGWNPVASSEYVNNLWKIATAERDIRIEMVRQLPVAGNVRQMGFRPQPIIRAIGLRWPTEAEDIVSKKWQERLTDPDQDRDRNTWGEAQLACATAALADRLTDQCKLQAKSHFTDYLAQLPTNSSPNTQWSMWARGRILGCLSGAQMLEDKVRDTGIQSALKDVEGLLAGGEVKDPVTLGSMASTVSQAVWLLRSDTEPSTSGGCSAPSVSASDFPVELRGLVLRSIQVVARGLKMADSQAPLSARPIVSLISALPCDLQRDALAALLDNLETRASVPVGRAGSAEGIEPRDRVLDTLLILAQGFEIAGSQHRESGVQHALIPLIERGMKIGSSAENTAEPANGARKIAEIVAARWIAPLQEAVADPAFLTPLLASTGVQECRNLHLAMAQSVRDYKSEGGFLPALRAGLAGRLTAACARSGVVTDQHDQSVLFDAVVRALEENAGRATGTGLMFGEGNAGGAAGGALTESQPRGAGDKRRSFAGEGLARAAGALVAVSSPAEPARTMALSAAKIALAGTGSAEEAAAVARSITNLLADRKDVNFVKEIVELLKYPTSALTAREWSALAPKNATDIFIDALLARAEIKNTIGDADPRRPGYHRRVLRQLQGNPKLACFSLESRVTDPRQDPAAAH